MTITLRRWPGKVGLSYGGFSVQAGVMVADRHHQRNNPPPGAMPNVFISYRRDDTAAGYASWIYDRLTEKLGASHVFMDVDSLAPGVDFVEPSNRRSPPPTQRSC